MSKTAKCIEMLCLLSEKGKLQTKELSDLLNTNQRNIREYRKELEEAGFIIQHSSGKNGGYELKNCRLNIRNV